MSVHGRPHDLETPIRAWGTHKPFILDDIRRARRSPLKILLKTFNDATFLEQWIEHHGKIVGYRNLIIADNWSTQQAVFKIYEKYNEQCVIFHFGGFHNFIHDREKFPELYEAINESCDYLLAIDTDEFLIQIDQDRWLSGPEILKPLQKRKKKSEQAFLSTYLNNYPYSDRIFSMGDKDNTMKRQCVWGKPIVPTSFAEPGQFIHNIQFPDNLFQPESVAGFFLQHLTQFSPHQRLAANRAKLLARKAIDPHASYHEIADMNVDTLKDSVVRRSVIEIRKLRAMPFVPDSLPPGHIRLGDGGALRFCEDGDAEHFHEAYRKGVEGFFEALKTQNR